MELKFISTISASFNRLYEIPMASEILNRVSISDVSFSVAINKAVDNTSASIGEAAATEIVLDSVWNLPVSGLRICPFFPNFILLLGVLPEVDKLMSFNLKV